MLVGKMHNCRPRNVNTNVDSKQLTVDRRKQPSVDTMDAIEELRGQVAMLTKRVADLELLLAKAAPAIVQAAPAIAKADRKAYQREYQRKRRKKAKQAQNA